MCPSFQLRRLWRVRKNWKKDRTRHKDFGGEQMSGVSRFTRKEKAETVPMTFRMPDCTAHTANELLLTIRSTFLTSPPPFPAPPPPPRRLPLPISRRMPGPIPAPVPILPDARPYPPPPATPLAPVSVTIPGPHTRIPRALCQGQSAPPCARSRPSGARAAAVRAVACRLLLA